MLFNLFLEVFSYLINQNNQNANWKKILGFRNMQENQKMFVDQQQQATYRRSIYFWCQNQKCYRKKIVCRLEIHIMIFRLTMFSSMTIGNIQAMKLHILIEQQIFIKFNLFSSCNLIQSDTKRLTMFSPVANAKKC